MSRTTHQESRAVSLAKGPVGLVGLVALIYGIGALIFGAHGLSTQHVPHGAVHGKKWLGLEVNGWSDLAFVAAGLLLMLGAQAHWAAKSMSLLVGIALAAVAVIAVIRGDGVFGLLAANRLTELVWGAGGVLLILLSLLPRVGSRRGTSRPPGTVPPAHPQRTAMPESQNVMPESPSTPKLSRREPTLSPAESAPTLSRGEQQEGAPSVGAPRSTTNQRRITTNQPR
jgi:hypothetical protein